MADDNNDGPQSSPVALRAAWATAKPKRRDYGTVVAELNSLKLVGEGSVFKRDPHAPVTHMGYFKLPRGRLPLQSAVQGPTIRKRVVIRKCGWCMDGTRISGP